MAKLVKATEASTAVTVAGQFTEESIPKMLEQINAKISQLNGDKEKSSRITGDLMGCKVSEVKDAMKLRELYAYITRKGEAVLENDEAFKSVAPTAKLAPYKEGGATVKQWQDEILTQYREVTFEEELKKLKDTKKVLEECLSEEAKKKARLQNAGEALNALLGL